MDRTQGAVFDPETIDLMRSVLDAAWASLLPEQQASVSRTMLAERILKAAAQGERDPFACGRPLCLASPRRS
jgi:hypothetical protein